MTKWPYHADGETVRDFAGDFVAAAESESTARFLAAVPMLYLYYKAVETVLDELRQAGSLDERQDNRIYTVREEVTKALANWSPT
jgi:hypothetical protein